MIQTEYLHSVFYPNAYKNKIDSAVEKIALFEKHYPFEAIAFTGVSGSAFAFTLGYLLNKSLICVRKTVSSHCGLTVEGFIDCRSYIIVDDFIATGATVQFIVTSIDTVYSNLQSKRSSAYPELAGIFLFDKLNFIDKECFNEEYPDFCV